MESVNETQREILVVMAFWSCFNYPTPHYVYIYMPCYHCAKLQEHASIALPWSLQSKVDTVWDIMQFTAQMVQSQRVTKIQNHSVGYNVCFNSNIIPTTTTTMIIIIINLKCILRIKFRAIQTNLCNLGQYMWNLSRNHKMNKTKIKFKKSFSQCNASVGCNRFRSIIVTSLTEL